MKKISISEMILEDTKKKILSGEYPAGEKLPNERKLAEYYEVSRVPVREALKELVDDGILETHRGVGTFVKTTKKTMTITEDGKKVNPFFNPQKILLETIRLRKLIESEAAKEAAKNATQAEIEDLETSLIETIREIRKMKQGEENKFLEADLNFHKLIAKISHNELFIEGLNSIPEIFEAHQYWSLKMTTPMDEVVSYHTAIYENIIQNNPEGAKMAMYSHLERVEKLLMKTDGQVEMENL